MQRAVRWKCRTQRIAKKSPSGHHRITSSGYIFATKARIDNRKKNLLSSNTSSTCPHNILNFGPITAEIGLPCLGHLCKFQRVSRLGSVTAWHSSGCQPNFAALNKGPALIRQGGHHVGHWPTFLVSYDLQRQT